MRLHCGRACEARTKRHGRKAPPVSPYASEDQQLLVVQVPAQVTQVLSLLALKVQITGQL
jgi:hypothetical protein